MSAGLRAQQEALVGVLFARNAPSNRGLQAYRSNGHALAQRALAAAYPVVAALLGDDDFNALARELWVSEPPARGDVGQWGGSLPALIERLPSLVQQAPYLADVARVEWCLHRAAGEADRDFDAGALHLLASCDPATIFLELAPGTCCIASTSAVASIVLAHRGQSAMETAGARLRGGIAEDALVWRRGFAPQLRIAHDGEREFIAALQEGRSLADSLDAAPRLDFAAWLAMAVQEQLLLRVRTP